MEPIQPIIYVGSVLGIPDAVWWKGFIFVCPLSYGGTVVKP